MVDKYEISEFKIIIRLVIILNVEVYESLKKKKYINIKLEDYPV